MALYKYSSITGLSRCISSIKSTSPSSKLVSIPARSPGLSMIGPVVGRMLTPISSAIIYAKVVFPKPGGPDRITWSSASPRCLAAFMNTFKLSMAFCWPMNSSMDEGLTLCSKASSLCCGFNKGFCT